MTTIRLRENLGMKITPEGCEIHGPRGLKILGSEHHELMRELHDHGLSFDRLRDLKNKDRAVVQMLANKGLLRRHRADYCRNEIWLSHFVDDARQTTENLSQKSVLIVGCGGTGALVADHLARAGVKKFVLVDGAHLDQPDLNRQWTYEASGVGRPKTELLAERLRSINGAEVRSFNRFIETAEDLADLPTCDLAVGAADKPRLIIENLLLDWADQTSAPIVFGSVGITDDFVGEVLSSHQTRALERERLGRESALDLEVRVAQGSLCFTNTLAAAKIGFAAYRFLVGISV